MIHYRTLAGCENYPTYCKLAGPHEPTVIQLNICTSSAYHFNFTGIIKKGVSPLPRIRYCGLVLLKFIGKNDVNSNKHRLF